MLTYVYFVKAMAYIEIIITSSERHMSEMKSEHL